MKNNSTDPHLGGATPERLVHSPPDKFGGDLDQDIIDRLDRPTIEALLSHHQNTVRKLKLRAAFLLEKENHHGHARADLDSAATAAQMVAAIMGQGKPFEAACREIAASMGLGQAQVEAHVKRLFKDTEKRARQIRDVIILQMASRGRSNAEISDKLGCHRNTVSRTIGRVFRKA